MALFLLFVCPSNNILVLDIRVVSSHIQSVCLYACTVYSYIHMCVDGCGWVDFSRVCGCVKGTHVERVKENLSVCSAGGHLELSCGRSGLWVSNCKNDSTVY